MAGRLRGYEISKPRPIEPSHTPAPPDATPNPNPYQALSASIDGPAIPPKSSSTRPLSDIREITEPSLIDVAIRRSYGQARPRRSTSRRSTSRGSSIQRDRSLNRARSMREDGSQRRTDSARKNDGKVQYWQATVPSPYEHASSSSYSSPPDISNAYSIPQTSVPRRSSSFGHARDPSKGHTRKTSVRVVLTPRPPPTETLPVPHHGRSQSPVKHAGLRLDPITSDAARRVPSRTHLRNPHPYDLLEYPSHKHPRVKLEVQVTAPVFVGGGSVEGFVKITVDENDRGRQRRSLGIGGLSVDVIGYEEASGSRRAIFLALVTELLDATHPPPPNMAAPVNPLLPGDRFWTLMPSTSALPFLVSLPLDTGPPPFQSRYARIRFTLSVTALVNDAGKLYRVRASQEIHVLPTYDPEKALTSLPSPLTASDELPLPRAGGLESIKVTAGLHRQVWVSGSTLFVDVHLSNRCHKAIKRLDLSLERDILRYKHAAAGTREKSAGQARVFESNHQTLIAMSTLRSGQNGWNGVEPHASETRTCDLELPRGHATVRCGKYFEVRYFLNITAALSTPKRGGGVAVQLPIILIHMTSLDVVPNSVAQVAAAIEEKRAHRHHHHPHQHKHHRQKSTESRHRPPNPHPSHLSASASSSYSPPAPARSSLRPQPSTRYTPGQAFAAPRQQSLDHQRAAHADLAALRHDLDASPRKHHPHPHPHHHYLPHQPQTRPLRKLHSNLGLSALSLLGVGGSSSSPGDGNNDTAFEMTPHPAPPRLRPRDLETGAETVESIRERMRRMASLSSLHGPRYLTPAAPGFAAASGGGGGGGGGGGSANEGYGGGGGGGGGRQENARPPPPVRPTEAPPLLGLGLGLGLPRRAGIDAALVPDSESGVGVGVGAGAGVGLRGATTTTTRRDFSSSPGRERIERSGRGVFDGGLGPGPGTVVRRRPSVGARIRGTGVGLWEQVRVRRRGSGSGSGVRVGEGGGRVGFEGWI